MDVQKKIIPWKNNTPDLDLELVFQDRVAKLGKSISRLIVVASLIDKPTNLGGKITVFQGACLKSFDPENLSSVQCHCAHFPHLTLLGSCGGLCGHSELGGGLPVVTRPVVCRAVPDLRGVRGLGARGGQPAVHQRQAVPGPQRLSRAVVAVIGGKTTSAHRFSATEKSRRLHRHWCGTDCQEYRPDPVQLSREISALVGVRRSL